MYLLKRRRKLAACNHSTTTLYNTLRWALLVCIEMWLWALTLASPWSCAEWRLNLEFGGTGDVTTTTSVSTRVVLPTQVLIESKTQPVLEQFMLGSGKSDLVTTLEDPTFISMSGEQTVRMGDHGGWKILSRRTGKAGDAGELRIWLDILDNFSKNELEVSAQRIYLTTNCWRKQEFDVGSKRLKPLKLDYQNYQRQIEDRLQHETGDRRLDGTNLVDTAMGTIDMGILVTKRDEARFRLMEAELKLPNSDNVISGTWPGSTESLFIAKGRIEIKEPQLLGEIYRPIGSWTATPLEDDVEYEYYEDNNDENEIG